MNRISFFFKLHELNFIFLSHWTSFSFEVKAIRSFKHLTISAIVISLCRMDKVLKRDRKSFILVEVSLMKRTFNEKWNRCKKKLENYRTWQDDEMSESRCRTFKVFISTALQRFQTFLNWNRWKSSCLFPVEKSSRNYETK